MSSSAENSQNIWNKFRSSTKNLSSSFSGLSIKGDSDGDTPTTTLVHKSLVKFYKNQDPFTGFPGWLGEKEDLPNEQKILRRQSEGKPSTSFASSWGSVKRSSRDRSMMSSKDSPARDSSNNTSSNDKEKRPTAGMSFQRIYNKEPVAAQTNPTVSSPPSRQTNSNVLPISDEIPEDARAQNSGVPARSNTSSTSMMMRDRLKRTNTKTSLKF